MVDASKAKSAKLNRQDAKLAKRTQRGRGEGNRQNRLDSLVSDHLEGPWPELESESPATGPLDHLDGAVDHAELAVLTTNAFLGFDGGGRGT